MLPADWPSELRLPELPYGSVWIIGAGAGDRRDLSPLAIRALGSADAVIHDPGISDLVLYLVQPPLTVSINGRSLGLVRPLKHFLEALCGKEWQERLDELAALRSRWREAGAGASEVARWTEDWVDRHDWRDEQQAPVGDDGATKSTSLTFDI